MTTRSAMLPDQQAAALFDKLHDALGRVAVSIDALRQARRRNRHYAVSAIQETATGLETIGEAWRELCTQDMAP